MRTDTRTECVLAGLGLEAKPFFAFWLFDYAGGPLRARTRPPLRYGHKARKLSACARRLARKLCARTLRFAALMPA